MPSPPSRPAADRQANVVTLARPLAVDVAGFGSRGPGDVNVVKQTVQRAFFEVAPPVHGGCG